LSFIQSTILPLPADTDNETGQVLRGVDSLPPVLRRYVHADNCWFQQEINEWEEQFCESQQAQQVQEPSPDPAGPSGPPAGSGPEAARQTPVRQEPEEPEELAGSEPRLETRAGEEQEQEEEEEEEGTEEEGTEEAARQEPVEGWWWWRLPNALNVNSPLSQ